MYTFMVNGEKVSTEKDEKLLPFLRETLGLTSVKNGCSEGACGTCMIILDGKAMKACVLKTSKLEGKEVVTVEGLSDRKKKFMDTHLVRLALFNVVFVHQVW